MENNLATSWKELPASKLFQHLKGYFIFSWHAFCLYYIAYFKNLCPKLGHATLVIIYRVYQYLYQHHSRQPGPLQDRRHTVGNRPCQSVEILLPDMSVQSAVNHDY